MKKQNKWKTVLKLDKNSQKKFTVHTFKTTRKIERRTSRVLKTSGYKNPEKKIHVHYNMMTMTQATTLTSIKNRTSDQALAQVA